MCIIIALGTFENGKAITAIGKWCSKTNIERPKLMCKKIYLIKVCQESCAPTLPVPMMMTSTSSSTDPSTNSTPRGVILEILGLSSMYPASIRNAISSLMSG